MLLKTVVFQEMSLLHIYSSEYKLSSPGDFKFFGFSASFISSIQYIYVYSKFKKRNSHSWAVAEV